MDRKTQFQLLAHVFELLGLVIAAEHDDETLATLRKAEALIDDVGQAWHAELQPDQDDMLALLMQALTGLNADEPIEFALVEADEPAVFFPDYDDAPF